MTAGSGDARRVGDELADGLIQLDPLAAAEWGFPVDTLPVLDPAWWQERRGIFAAALAALEHAAPSGDRDMLRERAEAEVMWIDSGEAYSELHTGMDSTLFRLRYVFDNLPAATEADRERAASVEAALPMTIDGYRRSLEYGRARGNVASRRQVVGTIDALRDWCASGVPAPDAFESVAVYLQDDYLPSSVDGDAVGAERFAVWSRRYSGVVIDHEDYDATLNELEQVLERLGPSRVSADASDLAVVAGEHQHLRWAEQQIDRAIVACHDAGILRETTWPPVVVRALDGGGQQAYYAAATRDGRNPATVWLAGGEGPHYVDYEKPVLFHESVPGHHVEATSQAGAAGLSRYQRLVYMPGHSEGWGLYAEHLADQAGLIDTPHAQAGALGSRALRLASLLIDVGVHTHRSPPAALFADAPPAWIPAVATALLQRVGLDEEVAAWWLTNMIGRPGHRASYAAGEQAWRDLVSRHGDVALAQVHNTALAAGPMGLHQLRSLDLHSL
jgi:uncharacterized protein (DUF885 family)